MKRFLVLAVIVIAAAAVLPAALTDCGALTPGSPGTGTLAQLVALGATGCQSQDKIFNNFVYTGTVSPADINFNVVLQTGVSDIHGWSFVPETAWINGFTLSYDITVAPGNPLVRIVQSKDQMNSGGIPNGITIADTQTTNGTPITLNMGLSGVTGVETVFSNYTATTVHTSTIGSIPTGLNLLSYEQDFFEVTAPEPVSFVLIGSGLLGLGLLGRRMRKS